MTKDYASKAAIFLLLICVALTGCKTVPMFPNRAVSVIPTEDGGRIYEFDTNKDKQTDYWQVENPQGRKVELRYFGSDGKSVTIVKIDSYNNSEVPHLVLAMDGVPYELVEQLYVDGYFRLFYPPQRVISTFPAMTDLAFWRIFDGKPPVSYQAKHFDRDQNRIISGNEIYLSGEAADWSGKLDYRCSFQWDPWAYVLPEMVFEHEMKEIDEVFRSADCGTRIAYSVATAGLGTRGGREAILQYLKQIDQFCEQMVYEKKGRVKITLLADHGHNMFGRERITFQDTLEKAGYRLHDRLEKPNDVVTIDYGLVTYAEFHTNDPAGVAAAILNDPATTVACYPQGDLIVAQTIDGKALIRRNEQGRFRYEMQYGDPLALKPILETLQKNGHIDADGFIDDRAMFEATVTHMYPDPLHRIWFGFHGLVLKPADLLVCLKDGYVYGSEFFSVAIGGATSTHGSLNRINSPPCLMTMLGPLPEPMRIDDVMGTILRFHPPQN